MYLSLIRHYDGAMIIQGSKIAVAASYLPLSDSVKISKV